MSKNIWGMENFPLSFLSLFPYYPLRCTAKDSIVRQTLKLRHYSLCKLHHLSIAPIFTPSFSHLSRLAVSETQTQESKNYTNIANVEKKQKKFVSDYLIIIFFIMGYKQPAWHIIYHVSSFNLEINCKVFIKQFNSLIFKWFVAPKRNC